LAFVSNLLDGTICVFGNDPSQPQSFLKIIGTIDLIEPNKEKAATAPNPNNAFPHGMVYSPVTGKIYNLNNGYGTITVIDPVTLSITNRITLTKCSNLLLDPTGRFVIAKGADRKTNADHVLGQLAVVDLAAESVVTTREIPDFYPSTFRFDPDGKKLYVTSAATGKGTQHANISLDTIRVYDALRLPALEQLTTLRVGRADCGRRPLAFFPSIGAARFAFFPNPTDGTLSIVDARSNEPYPILQLGEPGATEILFSFWDGAITGT
jgi:DNA-binding beta-propeller fold protein YncE